MASLPVLSVAAVHNRIVLTQGDGLVQRARTADAHQGSAVQVDIVDILGHVVNIVAVQTQRRLIVVSGAGMTD